MERYKFRGKARATGEWTYGDLLHYGPKYGKNARINATDGSSCYAVDIATVGQFTGLLDKYSKEIYEGDIVQIDCYAFDEPEVSCFGFVVLGWLGYELRAPDGDGGHTGQYLCDLRGSYLTEYTVCGNIYDNPEMLEVQ